MLFATVIHAVLIFGVGFTDEDSPGSALPALDVILVQSATQETPDKADFLANAAQAGGGTSEEAKRPTQVFTSPVPKPEEGVAPMPVRAAAPAPKPAETAPTPVLTQDQSALQVSPVQPREERRQRELPRDEIPIERSMEMARLASELDRQAQAYAKRPKRKFISANTREYAYANYMAAWVARVERVGNLNYPDEARRRKLEGSLVLTVAINKDGSLERIDIIRSSGQAVLDDAAQRIVELSAPFTPVPQGKEEIDILHITRTWQFVAGDVSMR
ncbi:MAG: energy transducer TonB [Rhodanobacteraceae bacterium]|nr:energy transducer TonB [Rhodanobacteraceae bacterium]